MPDLQVLPLLVSLVFDAMEEGGKKKKCRKKKKKLKTKQEKKEKYYFGNRYFHCLYHLELVAVQLQVTLFKVLFSLILFKCCSVLIFEKIPYKTP